MVEIPTGQKGESMYTNFDDMPMMLSVPQAAEVLGISAVSLYKLIRNDTASRLLLWAGAKVFQRNNSRLGLIATAPDNNCLDIENRLW